MKLSAILCCSIFLLVCAAPAQGLFGSGSLQDYVEGLVDATKFRVEGMLSLNDSSISRIWSYFKSKYGRTYSSIGESWTFFCIRRRFSLFRGGKATFSRLSRSSQIRSGIEPWATTYFSTGIERVCWLDNRRIQFSEERIDYLIQPPTTTLAGVRVRRRFRSEESAETPSRPLSTAASKAKCPPQAPSPRRQQTRIHRLALESDQLGFE